MSAPEPVALIPMESVSSTSLGAYGYDAERQVLAVEFTTGSIWHYSGVPLDVALEFGAAESKGKFYAARIRSQFSGARVTGPCKACKAEGYVGHACADCGCDVHYPVERREEY